MRKDECERVFVSVCVCVLEGQRAYRQLLPEQTDYQTSSCVAFESLDQAAILVCLITLANNRLRRAPGELQ